MAWRTVRVFISSTFRDMQAERDHLVRFVFPRVREELLHRRMHLVDVDLRWGVTSDQDAFDLCMDEIDRCHPRFLCMLGGRYGWIPPGEQRSITASEVHYAALDRLDRPAFLYFYFRDPVVTAAVPEPQAPDYREPTGSPSAEALAALKRRIADPLTRGRVLRCPGEAIEAPLPVFEYPCAWDAAAARITHLEEFGARVFRDILESVEAEFGPPEPEAPDEFAEERTAMEAFAESRIERYVVGSRGPIFEELRGHAEGDGGNGCLCLVGEAGCGKSALLARFWRDFADAHPGTLTIAHFTGASPASTNIRQVLRRLVQELAAATGSTDALPDDHEKLREAFVTMLEEAAGAKRVVIVMDAVNQLDSQFRAQAMRWLPERLPPTVRVILSTLPGPVLEALRARREPPRELLLPALDPADSAAVVDGFLGRYRKSLDVAQRAALLAKQDAGNPLYLLTALEELRTLGAYAEITQRIRELPGRVPLLFGWVLQRLEDDPGFRDEQGHAAGKDLVRRYCSYLAAGRSGMAEADLVELIAPGDPLGNVAALQRLLSAYLMQRRELLDFFHGQLREAVVQRYLAEPECLVRSHRELAAYFRRQADPAGEANWDGHSTRALSELPYHQTEGALWDELHATLTDLGFLEAKCTRVATSRTGSGGEARTVYGGVYELQEDFQHALERMPA